MNVYKIKTNLQTGELLSLSRSDGWSIPFAPDNTDYQTFKKDLADGAELFDAEGNVIDGIAYLATLES